MIKSYAAAVVAPRLKSNEVERGRETYPMEMNKQYLHNMNSFQ